MSVEVSTNVFAIIYISGSKLELLQDLCYIEHQLATQHSTIFLLIHGCFAF